MEDILSIVRKNYMVDDAFIVSLCLLVYIVLLSSFNIFIILNTNDEKLIKRTTLFMLVVSILILIIVFQINK